MLRRLMHIVHKPVAGTLIFAGMITVLGSMWGMLAAYTGVPIPPGLLLLGVFGGMLVAVSGKILWDQ